MKLLSGVKKALYSMKNCKEKYMKEYVFDAVIIGGGAAGMAAALEINKNSFNVAIIEREESLGGILLQCIHNGFGLHEFKEELTGPEYAQRFSNMVKEKGIKVFLDTTVMDIQGKQNQDIDFHRPIKECYCYSAHYGVFVVKTKAIILAMGCRERNRGNIGIPGTRPSGIFTAGLVQRLVNIDGYIPGKNIVIVGSGDIGLIMARRMTWVGCKVHAVVEIQPYPSGLTRNIVQCLNDFNIPLYLNHIITNIHGKDRIEKVQITPVEDGKHNFEKSFEIDCDTLLLSVGLIPENELSRNVGIKLNPQNNGPFVDSSMMTNISGIFACGNVLHVHDLVDFVTAESTKAGKNAVKYLQKELPQKQYKIKLGPNVRYIVPQKFNFLEDNQFYMRTMIVKNNAKILIKLNHTIIKTIKEHHIQPSEMINLTITKEDLAQYGKLGDPVIEVSII